MYQRQRQGAVRVVAIIAAYNEERFIGGCIEHLHSQGVEAYLIDNSSTDRTVEIAESYLGRGLIGVETLPRTGGVHRWNNILRRKEDLAESLEADWFIHQDPDEVRLPPRPSEQTLAEAIAEVDAQGYSAAHFMEFTFVPTREEPEHDHPDFMRTMRHYYPFIRNFPYRINAWKRQPVRVNLTHAGGHRVTFPEQRTYPEPFTMKHYQFLSLEQARIKYLEKKKYDVSVVRKDVWRYWLAEERMQLPSQSELSLFISDDELSLANPKVRHVMADWALPEAEREVPGTRQGQPASAERPEEGETTSQSRPVSKGQLIVAGFHRSGTSLTANLLELSGVFMGHEMVGKNRSQPHGHFEDKEIMGLHEEILADNRLTWQFDGSSLPVVGNDHRRRMREVADRREPEGVWGFKDPRTCLFLDEWKAIVPEAKVLVVYRYFYDATRSLYQRAADGLMNGTGMSHLHRRLWDTPDLALRMWLAHNKALLDFARAHPEDVLAVSFTMLQRNFPLIEALNRYWGLTLAQTPTLEVFKAGTSSEPRGRQLVSDEALIGETLQTWEELEKLGSRTAELTGIPAQPGERPTENAFHEPADAYAAELGREFTTFELRHARGLLAKARRAQKQLRGRLDGASSPEETQRLREAENDLKHMVKSMSGSKAVRVLRLKDEFRELERKYAK